MASAFCLSQPPGRVRGCPSARVVRYLCVATAPSSTQADAPRIFSQPLSQPQDAWLSLGEGCSARGEPPCPRSSHRAVSYQGRVVVFGGAPNKEADAERMGAVHT